MAEKKYLYVKDVARILGEEKARRQRKPVEQAKPFADSTVWGYVHRYANPDSAARKAALRDPESDPNAAAYKANPMPKPEMLNGKVMAWGPRDGETLADVEMRLRTWYRDKEGLVGRPRTKGPQTVKPHAERSAVLSESEVHRLRQQPAWTGLFQYGDGDDETRS